MICSYICYLLFLKIFAILLFARAIYLVHLFCIHLAFETVFLFVLFFVSYHFNAHMFVSCFLTFASNSKTYNFVLFRFLLHIASLVKYALALHVYASFFFLSLLFFSYCSRKYILLTSLI